MIEVKFGPDRIMVASSTEPAWSALEAVLDRHKYTIRPADTDTYNCRNLRGSERKSAHSSGIALDLNWQTNPYQTHNGTRKARYSSKASQEERAADVRADLADTDMTEEMIADILAISTSSGARVFGWGGDRQTNKEAMHFEIIATPEDLATGIDPATVNAVAE